jgi:hypothetical protein
MVNPSAYLLAEGIELMTMTGNLQLARHGEVKAICFASEPGPNNLFTLNNLFERRPKAAGLWARFTLRDGAELDGILSHNLLDWPESGYLLTPPRASGARQRVYLPRPAIAATELRGVVGKAAAPGQKAPAKRVDELGQLSMFDDR